MLMADAGIALGSQTVLLKSVNDDAGVLGCLMEKLLTVRVRPYYVHQLDRVPGTGHFQVPLEKSIRLINALRGTISGMAVPHLMVDLPHGGGKVALTADAVVKKGPDQWQIRNWEGKVFDYPVK
jgi:lysine 2,3-aminomutase